MKKLGKSKLGRSKAVQVLQSAMYVFDQVYKPAGKAGLALHIARTVLPLI